MTTINFKRRPMHLGKIAARQFPALLGKGKITINDIVVLPIECVDTTVQVFLDCALSIANVLLVYELARVLNSPPLTDRCVQFINASFVGLRDLLGDELLESALGADAFDRLMRSHNQVLADRLRLKKGQVREVQWPEGVGPNSDGTIPYELLALKLNRWPEFINPLQRERYLAQHEFIHVFKMQPQQFYEMPQWKQQRIKASVNLF